MIPINCPFCSCTTEVSPCSECQRDVSSFLRLRYAAERAYADVWSLANDRRIPEAISRIASVTTLYRDERFLNLAGWLYFLIGDAKRACQYWENIPDDARRAVELFNSSLTAFRNGRFEEAKATLDDLDVPLLPAQHLRTSIDGASQGRVATRPVRPGSMNRPWTAAAAAIVLLVIGGAAGFGLSRLPYRGAISPPSDSTPQDPDVISRPQSNDNDVLTLRYQILQAFLTREPDAVYRKASGARLRSGPLDLIRDEVPEEIRTSTARIWYQIGIRSYHDEDHPKAEQYLLASIASTGLQPGEYWRDDALYFLALTFLAQGRLAEAESAASHLWESHSRSMYLNSRIRALLPDVEDNHL